MNGPFMLPVDGNTKPTLPERLRLLLAGPNCPSQITVEGINQTFHIPSSINQAKRFLELDRGQRGNADDPDAQMFAEMMRKVSHAVSDFVVDLNSDSVPDNEHFANLLKDAIAVTPDQTELISSYVCPAVTYTLNRICGLEIESSDLASSVSNPTGEQVWIMDAAARGIDSRIGSFMLRNLNEEDAKRGILLFISVSYLPLVNFLSFGLVRALSDRAATISDLFRIVCYDDGPIYPGFFRQTAEGQDYLVPTTWQGSHQNFTFGYGSSACPGKSLSYRLFSAVVPPVQGSTLRVEDTSFRDALPYGMTGIYVTPGGFE